MFALICANERSSLGKLVGYKSIYIWSNEGGTTLSGMDLFSREIKFNFKFIKKDPFDFVPEIAIRVWRV